MHFLSKLLQAPASLSEEVYCCAEETGVKSRSQVPYKGDAGTYPSKNHSWLSCRKKIQKMRCSFPTCNGRTHRHYDGYADKKQPTIILICRGARTVVTKSANRCFFSGWQHHRPPRLEATEMPLNTLCIHVTLSLWLLQQRSVSRSCGGFTSRHGSKSLF